MASKRKISIKSQLAHAVSVTVWVFFAFTVTQIGILVLLEIAKEIGFRINPNDQVVYIFLLNAVIYSIALVITVGVPRLMGLLPKGVTLRKLLGISKKPKLSDAGLAILSYVAYAVVSAIILLLIITILPAFQADEAQELGFEALTHSYEYIFAFLALVIVAPLAEELLFRGYLFGKLRHYISFVPATIITSLLFAIVHWQWNVGVDVFILSLALCFLREKTQSLWPAVMLHSIKNGIAFVLLFIVPSALS